MADRTARPKYIPKGLTLRALGDADGWRRTPLEAVYEPRVYRFLLSDGTTVDVRTHYDSSDLRAAVLNATGVERIEGVVEVAPVQQTLELESS